MKISFTKGDETTLEISDETRALLRAEALRLLNEAQAEYETSASEFKSIADPNTWDVEDLGTKAQRVSKASDAVWFLVDDPADDDEDTDE